MPLRLIYALYRTLQWLLSPFIVLYFLNRTRKSPRYLATLPQRWGGLPASFAQPAPGAIWIHAVSVGEVIVAVGLIRKLRERLPEAPVFVSCTTIAGRDLAEQRLQDLAQGIFYAPVDFVWPVRRVLRTLRPNLLIVLETEIWPNLYREAKRFGCGLVVVNGRISPFTAHRYARLRAWMGPVLGQVDRILAESEPSYQRYLQAGAPAEKVELAGNLKYDFDPSATRIAEDVQAFLSSLNATIWIAASTMPPAQEGDPDEDETVIAAFQQLRQRHPRLLLILVPRHPERFDSAAAKLRAGDVPFLRRSQLGASSPAELPLPGVLLLDTMGELSGLYAEAQVVFMGGTLVRRGGHNILEPAIHKVPVIIGPHMENFPDIAAGFREARALVEIESPDQLAEAVNKLIEGDQIRRRLGDLGAGLAEARRGATARALRQCVEAYESALPRQVRSVPAWLLLWPLSRLWAWGSYWKRTREQARSLRLERPVVSIGNLTLGGAGKTPFTLWLARQLRHTGHSPAILTRGYRRRSPEAVTVAPPGTQVPIERTGDEAQILIREARSPVGIASSRYQAGVAVINQWPSTSVFVLDDGFQHWRLHRDADIVLIDALDPFGNHQPFPLGRCREPLEGLSRATLFVITRSEAWRHYSGIRSLLRRYNPHAPVFQARVTPECWVHASTGETIPLAEFTPARCAAFCGLANPASFWSTLGKLGLNPEWKWNFSDHHRYTFSDLSHLHHHASVAGAEALCTTEKDLMNLPDGFDQVLKEIPLFWLQIGLEVDDPDAIAAHVLARAPLPGG